MKKYPKPLSRLINEISKLPGVGAKSAQRLAFHIIDMDKVQVDNLTDSIISAKSNLKRCSVCGDLTDEDPCSICTDSSRRQDVICVVESPKDVMAMERTKAYNGLYHVLHGVLSPMEGTGPEDLNILSLFKRLRENDINEVILATNPNIEGEATAMYLTRYIKPTGIKITKLAHGLPVGADLEYADEVTLLKSLEGRKDM